MNAGGPKPWWRDHRIWHMSPTYTSLKFRNGMSLCSGSEPAPQRFIPTALLTQDPSVWLMALKIVYGSLKRVLGMWQPRCNFHLSPKPKISSVGGWVQVRPSASAHSKQRELWGSFSEWAGQVLENSVKGCEEWRAVKSWEDLGC